MPEFDFNKVALPTFSRLLVHLQIPSTYRNSTEASRNSAVFFLLVFVVVVCFVVVVVVVVFGGFFLNL